ncbi:YitT family protein [Paenibacillus spiritus]|uniref:YitT family protein n=1 Tax=Paenibacillus spiritus TaxID=2496557 RepID=A0A5J5GE63_9BACL|nr:MULTISPECIES: YitT family protein [Paenibacillus]KAA9006260.1 YitT family protein [Paenibacillus spiritus]
MNSSKLNAIARTVAPIMLGTAVYAFGLLYFILPNELMEGGVTGITILLNYAFGIPIFLTTLLINLPLFLMGWKMLGGRQIVYTGVGIGSLSFFLWLFERAIHLGWIEPFATKQDFILASLYAGVTLGLGLGIVFRFGGTTGGVDIVARIVGRKFGWSMGQFILASDVVIIGASLLFITKERVLYTLVAVFIASRVIDFIQEGAYAAKAFTIITDHGEEIARLVTTDLDRSATLIPSIGAYSKQAKHMVYCVVSRQEIRQLSQLVKSVDPRAFVIISDVHDVQGEGFREV